ncbi:MAG: SagB/ThcOx family dehydrogenase [Deltaproteobacteria bacterium]|nr:SagB/ThcOx family dehydrogenase [Deltaproteobacteria bacterium]
MKSPKEKIGERFQQETKYDPERMDGHTLDWSRQPKPFKDYKAPLAIVPLPEPDLTGDPHLWQLLYSRRSRREYDAGRSLTTEKLSALFWAAQGITARYGEVLFRTAPSAGGLYPVETYLLVRMVEGLEQGIYHFRPQAFDLEFLQKGDLARDLSEAALGQQLVMAAQVTFIWTAVVERSRWKYRQRAYRYIYLDAGHIGENLYLAAGALGLGCCAIGAFYDDKVNTIIGVDGIEEAAIYMATVGWPQE